MKILKERLCLNCKTQIPATTIIKNKRRNLCNRRYCLECQPHKEKIKFFEDNNHKQCSKCKEIKPKTDEFWSRRAGKESRFFCWCKKCNAETTIEKQHDLKRKAVEYKGGKCFLCGYNKCLRSLGFHHVDKNKKLFGIGSYKHYKFEDIKTELDKCILVCANCHGEIHEKLDYPEKFS